MIKTTETMWEVNKFTHLYCKCVFESRMNFLPRVIEFIF